MKRTRKYILPILLGTSFLMCNSPSSFAQEYQRTYDSFSKMRSSNEYKRAESAANYAFYERYDGSNDQHALELLLPFAKQGEPIAQRLVGELYNRKAAFVDGENSNTQKQAFNWYLKSANQGDALAQFSVGSFYESGKGVQKDISIALEWYLKSANQGDVIAQNHIATIYEYGVDVDKNLKQAFDWRLKAANQGYALAQYSIAEMYYNGEGVKQDIKESKKWAELACQNNEFLACKMLMKFSN